MSYPDADIIHILGGGSQSYSEAHTPTRVLAIERKCEARYDVEPLELKCYHGVRKQDSTLIESIIQENLISM